MGEITSKWMGKIRRFLECEGRPLRACVVARGVLTLEGKHYLEVPADYQMVKSMLCLGIDWKPAPWRRVSRGVYAPLEKKEGGAA